VKLIHPQTTELPDFAEDLTMVEVIFPGERKSFDFSQIIYLDGEKKVLVAKMNRDTKAIAHFIGLPLVVYSRPKIR
jgi:hypothetical protein